MVVAEWPVRYRGFPAASEATLNDRRISLDRHTSADGACSSVMAASSIG